MGPDVVYKIVDPIRVTQNEEGIVTLSTPQDHMIQRWARAVGFKIPREKHLELDEYGSFIISRLDGAATLEQIALSLKERYGEAAEPLQERLAAYLSHLEKNLGMIEPVTDSTHASNNRKG